MHMHAHMGGWGSWGFCTFGAGVDVNEGEKQDKPQVKLNSSPYEDIFTWNAEVTALNLNLVAQPTV